MLSFDLFLAKVLSKLFRRHEYVVEHYRKQGVKIGKNCLICSNPVTKEPTLVEIGDHVTVSTNVSFVTHDNSIKMVYPDKTDLFGRIKIGNDCFIGENATLMYGVTLGEKVIVAAGSVVTKSFTEPEIIIGGNPARIISHWETFKEKNKDHAICRNELYSRLQSDDSFLVNK